MQRKAFGPSSFSILAIMGGIRMKHIYAVETKEELEAYQKFVFQIQISLNTYVSYLQQEFQVVDFPNVILWTSYETAARRLSDVPLPAYTNSHRIVITPDLCSWRKIYLHQADDLPEDTATTICHYYTHCLNGNHVLQILGHELAHHSKLFLDEVYESGKGIWFEEGMVEYISRRYFLTEEEFRQEAEINRQIVALHGKTMAPLDTFGRDTYQGDISSIFLAYWRSFLAVSQIVEDFGGNISAVFSSYHRWYETGSPLSLAQWFRLEP